MMRDTFRRGPPAAAGAAAGIPLRPARAPISRAAERRGRAAEGRRAGRARGRQRPRPLDLCASSTISRPHRPAAGRGGRPGPRQPRAAARAQRLHDVRRLARRAEGRRRGRRDHAAAAPGEIATVIERARDQPRDRRQPLHRRLPRGADQTHCVKHLVKYDGDYGRASWRRAALARAAAARRHRPRRSGADRLHQRHDRRAQGLRPVPPRRARAVRQLREASDRDEARRRRR